MALSHLVHSSYLAAPVTDVQLSLIAVAPAGAAVSTGADCADRETCGKFDQGPSGWLLASIARTAYT